jgi:hypothetical protein
MEVFIDVENYEGLYAVSNYGNVLSYAKNDGNGNRDRLLKLGVSSKKSGEHTTYRNVTFSKDGIVKRFQVHQLVAKAFIANPLNKPHVNHIDNDGSNNHVSNLEWTTPKENMQHSSVQGRQDKSRKMGGDKLGKIKSFKAKVKLHNLIGQQSGNTKIISILEFGKHPKGECKCLRCGAVFRNDLTSFIGGAKSSCRSCAIKLHWKKKKWMKI